MLSEASVGPSRQTLRFAQGDKSFPILLVKLYNHAPTKELYYEKITLQGPESYFETRT